MKVQDVMKKSVVSVGVTATIEEAARLMRDHSVGFVPVCDENRRVRGVLTDRDIAVRVVAAGLPPSTAAIDAMTMEIVAVRPDEEVEVAAGMMADNHKSRILVTSTGDVLEGVLSLSDLAEIEDPADAGKTLQSVASRENASTSGR